MDCAAAKPAGAVSTERAIAERGCRGVRVINRAATGPFVGGERAVDYRRATAVVVQSAGALSVTLSIPLGDRKAVENSGGSDGPYEDVIVQLILGFSCATTGAARVAEPATAPRPAFFRKERRCMNELLWQTFI